MVAATISPGRLLAACLIGLALPGTRADLRAQSTPDRALVDPVPFEWATTRVTTGFPVGYPDRRVVRYQQVHDGLAGRTALVSAIAFRRAPNDLAPAAAFRAALEMRLSTSRRSASRISATFADNAGADEVQVTNLRNVDFPATAGPWDGPAPFDYVVPSDVPFAFAGAGPLCVELRVHDHDNLQPLRFALHAEGFDHVTEFGSACGNLSLQTGLQGDDAVHELSGVDPGTPVLLLFGQSFDRSAAGPLPLDLEPLGAPGCMLGLAPLFDIRGRADAVGRFELIAPLAGVPPGLWYGVQGVAVQPGVNALGAITSATSVVLPQSGRTVGRVWSEDLNAATGLRQPVFGLVLQVRE